MSTTTIVAASAVYVVLSTGVLAMCEEAMGPPGPWDRPLMFLFWWAGLLVYGLMSTWDLVLGFIRGRSQ